MTKQIDEMDADELRIEIAKERGFVCEIRGMGFFVYKDGIQIGAAWDEDDAWKSVCSADKIPNWPTSIADAWELVEEMRIAGIACAIMVAPDTCANNDKYEVKLYTAFNGSPKEIIFTCADTAPLAICRAWLRWKRLQ